MPRKTPADLKGTTTYRISVPMADADTVEFLSHQHSISMSIRWLIKQFVAEYGTSDIFCRNVTQGDRPLGRPHFTPEQETPAPAVRPAAPAVQAPATRPAASEVPPAVASGILSQIPRASQSDEPKPKPKPEESPSTKAMNDALQGMMDAGFFGQH